MAAGVTDRLWEVADMVEVLEARAFVGHFLKGMGKTVNASILVMKAVLPVQPDQEKLVAKKIRERQQPVRTFSYLCSPL
jgi:hypothetical protein